MIKAAKTDLSSFSTTKWVEFAKAFGLPKDPSNLRLKRFSTPGYRLPLSLQVSMFENAWRSQDVYGEKIIHTREAPVVKILEPVCQRLLQRVFAYWVYVLDIEPTGSRRRNEQIKGRQWITHLRHFN